MISRSLDRKMILDDLAKEKFRELLVHQCAFSQNVLDPKGLAAAWTDCAVRP
jgi:hypothetical protein